MSRTNTTNDALKQQLLRSFAALEREGFRRRGLRWERDASAPLRTVTVELQRSKWGNDYYVNVIVFPVEHSAPFPIIHRVPGDIDIEGHQLGDLLGENGPDERERLLASFVEQNIAALATRASTVEGLREVVRGGGWMIEPAVRARLALPALPADG